MSGSISSLRRSDFEARVEIGATLGRQQVGDRAARELPADDRGALEHRALLGSQALDAGREQRVDRRRHLQRRRARPPVVQRSPSRFSAPSCTSMRTSSPTKSGLPSLVASTRPATAAGSSSAPMTFAASRVAAPASSPASVDDVGHQAARYA